MNHTFKILLSLFEAQVMKPRVKKLPHSFGCHTVNQVDTVIWLVSWCSEPSQPQRITSGLNTNFSLSPSYSFHKSLYNKSFFLLLLSLSQTTAQILSTISERKTRKTKMHVLEPVYIRLALNMGTCIQQGDLFYSVGLHWNQC